jgi:hypothetical protein
VNSSEWGISKVKRTGALFQRPFKRIPVDNISYLMRLIVYIHQNPQKHHLQSDRMMQYFVRIHQEIRPLEVPEE